MSNKDVIGLWIDQQRSVDFIPQNLMNFFPNMKLLTISSCGLKTVSSTEMRQFGLNLEVLGFYENFIEEIASNLFQFNPNLRWIAFRGNKVRNVGFGVFRSTPNLVALEFENNVCISRSVVSNAPGMASLLTDLGVKCPPTMPMLGEQLIEFEGTIDMKMSQRFQQLNAIISQLDQETKQNSRSISNFDERIRKLEGKT
jgi:hypothetical protein